ncbi:hypothetical protein [Moraxella lacunata]|uniref:hypothetical protein n=1 Tax=Moraxella lacunata TaxID=477 RepID=UPI003EE12EE1
MAIRPLNCLILRFFYFIFKIKRSDVFCVKILVDIAISTAGFFLKNGRFPLFSWQIQRADTP